MLAWNAEIKSPCVGTDAFVRPAVTTARVGTNALARMTKARVGTDAFVRPPVITARVRTNALARMTEARGGTGAIARPGGQSPPAQPVLLARIRHLVAVLVVLLSPASARAADCLAIQEADQHIGETKCVTGRVVRVKVGIKGVHFLDFCEDQLACPFTVVVFAHDLKDVGDVRRLAGRTIEIRGALKIYDGRPEIILSRISQIEGGAAMIPPLPKNYDVENRGHYSAGRLYPSKKPTKKKATPDPTATYGTDVEESDQR
jgi:hypothetical protein